MEYKLGYFLKVPVYFHITLLIPFALLLPVLIKDPFDGLLALTSVITVYTCVFLHEFGHILTARHFGIRCNKVIVSVIGGVAILEGKEQRSEPKEELLISLAGPAVNLILAFLFMLMCLITGCEISTCLPIQINLAICIFNMLPFYPMDGGRVLKCVLHLLSDRKKARFLSGFISFLGSCFLIGIGIASGGYTIAVIGALLLPFNLNMVFEKEEAGAKK